MTGGDRVQSKERNRPGGSGGTAEQTLRQNELNALTETGKRQRAREARMITVVLIKSV